MGSEAQERSIGLSSCHVRMGKVLTTTGRAARLITWRGDWHPWLAMDWISLNLHSDFVAVNTEEYFCNWSKLNWEHYWKQIRIWNSDKFVAQKFTKPYPTENFKLVLQARVDGLRTVLKPKPLQVSWYQASAEESVEMCSPDKEGFIRGHWYTEHGRSQGTAKHRVSDL